MKTINIFFAVIAVVIALVSCTPQNVQMTTVVNADGSFVRSARFEVDSLTALGEKMDHKLVVNVLDNDLWCKEWETVVDAHDSIKAPDVNADEALVIRQAEQEDGSFTTEVFEPGQYVPDEVKHRYYCTASRSFKDVDELNANYPVEINGKNILKNANLSYSFRGFYTDVTFTEEYVDLSSCFDVPHDNYLTADELSYWVSGFPNIVEGMPGQGAHSVLNEIDSKFLKWYWANKIYDMLTVISTSYALFEDCPLKKDDILALRDSVYHNSPKANLILAEVEKLDVVDPVMASDVVLGTDYFKSNEKLNELNRLISVANTDEKYVNIAGGDCIIYSLVMPGEVISAGRGKLDENGSVEYIFAGTTLLSPDYTITATSRVINYWFCILALLLIVAPVVITVIIRRKK
ncbi:MAG: hypothetical protein MJZ27_02140 [Bacteroidales bacterium]|nr:hypothetical protein [Bacteroidales bacterium]